MILRGHAVPVIIAAVLRQAASSSAPAQLGQLDGSSLLQAWMHTGRDANTTEVSGTNSTSSNSSLDVASVFVGCFKVNHGASDPDFKWKAGGHHYNTSTCLAACAKKNHAFYALQHAGDCYCGKSTLKTENLQDVHGKCGDVCAHDDLHWCGGTEKRAVYQVARISSSYEGCYRDDGNDRSFDIMKKGQHFSTASCRQACAGHSYMALQASGKNCFCSNHFKKDKRHSKVADDKCGGACAGEDTTPLSRCGGRYINAVYSLRSVQLATNSDILVNAAMPLEPNIINHRVQVEPKASNASKKAKAQPEAAKKVEAQPEAAEKVEAQSEAEEKVEAQPEAEEKVEAKPEAAEKVEAKPEAAEKVEAKPEAAEKVEATPEAAEKVEAQPEAAEKVEAQPEAAEKVEAQPEAEAQPSLQVDSDRVAALLKFLDLDGDAVLSRRELSKVLKALDPARWAGPNFTRLLRALDTNGDGELQSDEYGVWLSTAADIKDLMPVLPKAAPRAKPSHAAKEASQAKEGSEAAPAQSESSDAAEAAEAAPAQSEGAEAAEASEVAPAEEAEAEEWWKSAIAHAQAEGAAPSEASKAAPAEEASETPQRQKASPSKSSDKDWWKDAIVKTEASQAAPAEEASEIPHREKASPSKTEGAKQSEPLKEAPMKVARGAAKGNKSSSNKKYKDWWKDVVGEMVSAKVAKFDANNDGLISQTELSKTLMEVDAEKWTEVNILLLFWHLDKNANNLLESDEYSPWFQTAIDIKDLKFDPTDEAASSSNSTNTSSAWSGVNAVVVDANEIDLVPVESIF